jgi:hypothetical protein
MNMVEYVKEYTLWFKGSIIGIIAHYFIGPTWKAHRVLGSPQLLLNKCAYMWVDSVCMHYHPPSPTLERTIPQILNILTKTLYPFFV